MGQLESKDFFLLLLSVPLSLLVNLITPRVQRLLATFSGDIRAKRVRRAGATKRMWEWFARNPQVYTLYLLRSGIALIRNVVAAVALGGLFLFVQSWDAPTEFRDFQEGASLACYLALIALASHIYRHAYKLQYAWFKVREINAWPADFYFNPIVEHLPADEFDAPEGAQVNRE